MKYEIPKHLYEIFPDSRKYSDMEIKGREQELHDFWSARIGKTYTRRLPDGEIMKTTIKQVAENHVWKKSSDCPSVECQHIWLFDQRWRDVADEFR